MKFAAILCLVLALSVGYAAEEPPSTVEVAHYHGRRAITAWDIISNEPDLSTLAALIKANNLTAALNDPKHRVSVFAPTNAALAALPNGTLLAGPLLTSVLLQHVTYSKVSSYMRIGSSVPSLNPGNSITRVAYTGTIHRHFGGKSRITSWKGGQGNKVNSNRRIETRNAVVIVLDGVLLPNNVFASIEAAATFYNYTAFLSAVTSAGLLDEANSVVFQKTVFAPNNAAFAAGAANELTEAQILAVLMYHVSPVVVATPFKNITIPTLLDGNSLKLVAPTSVVALLSDATVVTPPALFPGGVFLGIDALLIPDLG